MLKDSADLDNLTMQSNVELNIFIFYMIYTPRQPQDNWSFLILSLLTSYRAHIYLHLDPFIYGISIFVPSGR
jgi:hypothetical protein